MKNFSLAIFGEISCTIYSIGFLSTIDCLCSRAVNFANLPKNLFPGFNFCEFMPSVILYCNNSIFTEVIFANLQNIANP